MPSEGRLMRWADGRWSPIGDPLTAWSHLRPEPHRAVATWVLARDPAPMTGDIVVFGEQAHRLLVVVPADDPEWDRVAGQALMLSTADEVAHWLRQVVLWLGQRVEPGREWPLPPADVS